MGEDASFALMTTQGIHENRFNEDGNYCELPFRRRPNRMNSLMAGNIDNPALLHSDIGTLLTL